MATLASLKHKPFTSKVFCFTLIGSRADFLPMVIKSLDIDMDVLAVDGSEFTKSTVGDVVKGYTKLEDFIAWVLVDKGGYSYRINIYDFNREILRLKEGV